MSYEKLYGKKFIKMSDNTYIPMVLTGSSNCTMFVGGREILEREWHFWNKDICFKTKDEILSWVNEKLSSYQYELFKEGSAWVTGKEIYSWFENCIKKANTLEEIFTVNPYRKLECFIYMSHKTKYGDFKYVMRKYITDETELKEWWNAANEYVSDNTIDNEYNKYIHIGFTGIEQIRVSTKPNGSIKVKFGSQYLTHFDEGSFTTKADKEEALVFTNVEDFLEKIKDTYLARRLNNCKYIKA